MASMKKSILSFVAIVILGCTTTNQVEFKSEKNEGQWEAKAQVRNLRTNTVQNLNLDVMAIRNQIMRIEISGPLGIQVGSLLMKKEDLTCLIHTQKKAYTGTGDENSLENFLKVKIDPRWLYSVFFDVEIPGWACEGKPVVKCERNDGTSIAWTEREGEKKRVTIKGLGYQMQVLVTSFQSKVEKPEKVFNLIIPDSYTKYKLN